ncbi:DUF2156 domain-containing protein [Mycoplasmatota bacterium]|nr:DUF2156 domain-containing protein [Mycoplasmatota bacterium]
MNVWLKKLKNHPKYQLWNMKEIELKDKEIYEKYIQETTYEASVWSSNFTYLWAHTNSTKVNIFKAMIDGLLVTFILSHKGRLYLPCLPFGKADVEHLVDVLLKCAKLCFEWNQQSRYFNKSTINPINSIQLDFLKTSQRFEHYFREERLTGLERHYSIDKLLDLSGKDFSKVRNKINKFNRMYPNLVIRNYQPDDFQSIMELGEGWENTSGGKYRRIIDGFYFEPIISHYKELNHIIIVFELDGKIIGMTTVEILPTGQAWGCVTKFIKDYHGISEKLTIEVIKKIHEINPQVKYINVGSDLGSKGLAFFKERFRPVLNYERYAVFYKY